MKKILYAVLLSVLFLNVKIFSQTGDIKIGTDLYRQGNYNGAFFDYSDPEAVNIKVAVWGFVRFPGRYMVPSYTKVKDLLSYAGGPTDDAKLQELKLYRVLEDSTQQLINLNYNELLWEKVLTSNKDNDPPLIAGDVLIVPGRPKLYFRDYFSLTLSVISTLISLAILIFK